MKHSHKIGGSTADRIIACPFSMTAPEHPEKGSSFAAEGTYLHGIMEQLLRGDIEETALADVEGMTEDLLNNKILPALDAFDALADSIIHADDDWDMFLPETTYSHKGNLEGCFGTSDFVGRYRASLVILDWKFGDGIPVSPVDNSQSKFYGSAIMDENPLLFDGVTDVIFAIVQPRRGEVYTERDGCLETWHTTPDVIVDFRKVLVKTLKVAEGKNPPCNTGDHCRFCKHKPVCKAVDTMVDVALLSQPDAMTPEQLGAAMSKVQAIESWALDIMKLGQAVLDEGGTVPGWKLVAKRAYRKWTDEEAVEKALKNMKASLMECKERPSLKSPAQVEKILATMDKDFSKLAPFIHQVSSGNTLAPESDKRPGVQVLSKHLEQLGEQLKVR